ncbi:MULTISPECIES: hypothetical protein [unclassified Thioalkalivibrio]|uniref:hypothetical protein n=1 Tax=unclassified Thioalkalivibrio TaxID=2621013 RepID=UPI000377E4E2|nr:MULTISPECIES: hypothetical protein [unclassified Thioalkalivibrio]
MKLVKLVKLNNLQYNPNRDPEVYRRPINEEFRVQASLNGSGTAQCKFSVEGETLCEGSVSLPGTFDCKFSYDTAGTRIGDLVIEGNGETFHEKIRIDVLEHAWIG